MRFDLSDEEWALLAPLLPKNRKSARVDDRRILNAIFYGLRTGMPWRDLPGTLRALHNSLQSVQPLVSRGHLEAHLRRVGIEISRQLVSDRQHDVKARRSASGAKGGRKIRRSASAGAAGRRKSTRSSTAKVSR
jgi:transposase